MDGVDLSAIRLVAQIRSISIKTTNTVFFVGDGTGSVEAKAWKESSVEEEEEQRMNEEEGLVYVVSRYLVLRRTINECLD